VDSGHEAKGAEVAQPASHPGGDVLLGGLDQVVGEAADPLLVGTLEGKTLVATVMSNLGLERAIDGLGGTLLRTAVGDRYVVEA
jgi:hypothetical protein